MGVNEGLTDKQVGGITANRLAIPIIIVIILLLLMVIFLFFSISRESQELSMIMQKTGEYTADANGLLAGSSKLSETATTYILMPKMENSDVNFDPLFGYAEELKADRRGTQVEERFEKYQVSDEDRAYIAEAADAANSMLDSQLHAMALMNSVYSFSDVPALSSIPLPELSAKENAYSDKRKQSTARQLVLDTEYALNKQTVSVDVNACCGNLKKESGIKIQATLGKVQRLRIALWFLTALLLLTLILTFVLLYQQILTPMKKMTRQIRADQPLNQVRGLREARELAYAYNALLRRRDTLDDILRSAAETDALTNLPNRYAFQQYLLETTEKGYALGVMLFDVNYLKKTNDTLGHSAGDELLRKSADCISTCFGSADENNCFRLGGDEFAAVIKNPAMDIIDQEVKMFILEQQRKQISISWGYALASELDVSASLKELIETADKRMYQQKKVMHEEHAEDSANVQSETN